eukprot:Platyproteum_vivax@DN8763_c0_g1_i1.p1
MSFKTSHHFYENYLQLFQPMDLQCKRFLVGRSAKVFIIPVDVLSRISPVFDAMIGGSFKEAHQSDVVLPEDDADHFSLFLELIPYSQHKSQFVTVKFEALFGSSLPKLVLIWKLAYKYQAMQVCELLSKLAGNAPTKALKPIDRPNGLYYFHQLVNQTIKFPPVVWSDEALQTIVDRVPWKMDSSGNFNCPLHEHLVDFEPSSVTRLLSLIGKQDLPP